MKFFTTKEVEKLTGKLQKSDWTAVIPAAGRGSRLGHDQPKVLYPILGRPILDWLIDLLTPFCRELVFVLSPDGAAIIKPLLEKRLPGRYQIVIQAEPTGMADAINRGSAVVTTENIVSIWGDQAGVAPTTVKRLLSLHQNEPTARLTLPLSEQKKPYIHYQTDQNGLLTGVLKSRESDPMPPVGLADSGIFALKTAALRHALKDAKRRGLGYTGLTKEWDFVLLFPYLETGGQSIQAFPLGAAEQTISVNTKEEAELLENYLKKRR
ncbi:MAG TPA: NTP transferase domain-containing protein [Candidatus Saccharimonadales bacterium]|nr:NTP transferase domain-containing protein [Candidatus Saccharimonadales bacterium]